MRERLAPHYQETHCFTADFASYSKTEDGNNVACFRNVKLNGKWVCDHVWIHRSKHMKNLELKHGDKVQFEARVGRYTRGFPRIEQEVEFDYNLEKVREFIVVQRHTEGS